MASEKNNTSSSSEDEPSDSGSTESSPLVSDVEQALGEGETSLEHRFFQQRREIAWRWTWLKLQCTDLRRQEKKCEETLTRIREQKGRLKPLAEEKEDETHALRTTGITPPKQNRKLIKRPPDVGQIRNPFQEAAAHTLFSLKPPVVKKVPEKKNPLTASVASVATVTSNTSPPDVDQSSEAQQSVSVDQPPAASASAGAEVPDDGEDDFYGEFYETDESDERARPRSHKRSSRGGDDDAVTPKRKMSRSVDFELPDTKALTSSRDRSRRSLRASDWDMNNIVVPLSITSPRALQVVRPKEIVTPGWKSSAGGKEAREGQGEVRLIDEDAPAPQRPDGAVASSSENTADELYHARHAPHEKAERARWETPLLEQQKKKQQQQGQHAHDPNAPNDFLVTGEFDRMQSGGQGGKGAPRRLDFGAERPRSHKKGGSSHGASAGGGGGGGGGGSRRMRPSRAGLYWMRSRFYADLKWELVRREGQPETVFVFRHLDGPIPQPPDRSLKRNSIDSVVEDDDEVEVTIRHRTPAPLSAASAAASAAPAAPPPPPDLELAEAPYSPSRADNLGGEGLHLSAQLSLSLASSVGPDSTMADAEAEAEELEMQAAQLERSGDLDIEGEGMGVDDMRPEMVESRTFDEDEEEAAEAEAAEAAGGRRKRAAEEAASEEGASPRQRAWAVRSMLNGVSEDSDVTIKVRTGASAAAKDSAASTGTPAAAKTPAAAEQVVRATD